MKEYLAFDLLTSRRVVMKRYLDLSEGVSTEALNIIECLKAVHGGKDSECI
jgi:hypothetical protein